MDMASLKFNHLLSFISFDEVIKILIQKSPWRLKKIRIFLWNAKIFHFINNKKKDQNLKFKFPAALKPLLDTFRGNIGNR